MGEVEEAREIIAEMLASVVIGWTINPREKAVVLRARKFLATPHTPPPVATATVVDAGEVEFLRKFHADWARGVPDSQLRRDSELWDDRATPTPPAGDQ